jgi:predicted DNA-binding transcriptional regulator YafY
VWYLVAAADGDYRTYRVSRMRQVEVLERPAARPPGFDLAAYWTASSAQFVANLPRFPITVRVHADVARRLWIPGAYARIVNVSEPGPDGWRTADLLLQTEEEACSYVLGFGDRMRVLEPASLRTLVRRRACEIVTMYDAPDDPLAPAPAAALPPA